MTGLATSGRLPRPLTKSDYKLQVQASTVASIRCSCTLLHFATGEERWLALQLLLKPHKLLTFQSEGLLELAQSGNWLGLRVGRPHDTPRGISQFGGFLKYFSSVARQVRQISCNIYIVVSTNHSRLLTWVQATFWLGSCVLFKCNLLYKHKKEVQQPFFAPDKRGTSISLNPSPMSLHWPFWPSRPSVHIRWFKVDGPNWLISWQCLRPWPWPVCIGTIHSESKVKGRKLHELQLLQSWEFRGAPTED